MAPSTRKAFLLLLVVMAAAVLYRPADVTAMQLEDADELNDAMADEAASFSEMDADTLADKLDEDDEDSVAANDEGLSDEEEPEAADAEAQSFFEGDEEEDLADDEIDLSEMSEEDAAAVMEMLSPDEQKAFREMLDEHKSANRETEL